MKDEILFVTVYNGTLVVGGHNCPASAEGVPACPPDV